ncbi:MAG TPA: acetyl-CoA carboxylase carboxyltransferase subunit alpha [Thermoanaerobaculia bacterium]|nr:acetyl-CoA carboxylase carboxyltransferase subunit alpha [Thermoanaerobaculia bacterium]
MNGEDGQFEEPILRLRQRIEELSALPDDAAHRKEIERLREKLDRTSREIYAGLTPWQKTLVARHPTRPYTLDYIGALMTDFVELHGDRNFAEDAAVVAGLARFRGRPVAIVGHQKGRDTKEKIRRNFGMPRPEGFRKALRVMQLAEKFERPIISFVDTAGAFPGIDAEERGQAEAIAVNLRSMAGFRVPIIVAVTGEGGSGGALALSVGDRILMLEHAIYSVISPEGCAAILWKDASRKKEAAAALRVTAGDLAEFGIIDEIVPEPPGGAHADPTSAAAALGEAIERHLREVSDLTTEERRERRYRKFRAMGRFESHPVG